MSEVLFLFCYFFFIQLLLFVICLWFGCYVCRYRDQLEEMLHKISCDKKAIADGMLFCLDHADCAEEVIPGLKN